MDSIKLRCVTLNCRGLRDQRKRLAVFQYLKDEHIDIAFLQETYVTQDFIGKFNQDWAGNIFHGYSDSNHSKGVAILFNEGLFCNVLNSHRSEDGRRIMLNIHINEVDFCLVSAYAPDKSRVDFIKKTIHVGAKQCLRY
jgi:exonuclease III